MNQGAMISNVGTVAMRLLDSFDSTRLDAAGRGKHYLIAWQSRIHREPSPLGILLATRAVTILRHCYTLTQKDSFLT